MRQGREWGGRREAAVPSPQPGPAFPPPASPAGHLCMGLPALGVPSTAVYGLGVPSFSSLSLSWVPFRPSQSSQPQT